jgi:hypothetical protein
MNVLLEMSVSKQHGPAQFARGDDGERKEAPPAPEARTDSNEMSHVSMGALALAAVAIAGLALVYVSRHFHQHPGAVLAVLVGTPAVIALMFIVVARRRREHA